MRIALLGGSFDPPHLAHQQIAQYLREQELVDEVRFVPARQHPFGKPLSPVTARLEMCQLLGVNIETYELDQPELSYSYKTLQALAEREPKNTFQWVIGSDNLQSFNKWFAYEKILQEFGVLVYPRAGFGFEPIYTGMKVLEKAPTMLVSSTEIRQKVRDGEDVTGLVGAAVSKYIKDHRLYT